jgi:hypothetical protein
MKLKKIACLFAAALISVTAVMTAYADEEKTLEEYKENADMLTDDNSAPTLSFDMSDWKNYVKTTKDADVVNIEAKQESDTAYQGRTLKISASADKDVDGMFVCASSVRDSDNNLVYPDSENEDAEFLLAGVEIDASDLGITYFDGALITFNYRINPDAEGILMGDSCFVFPMSSDDESLSSNTLRLQYNDSDSNNTSQYASAVLSVSDNIGASKLVFEVPLVKATSKMDILYVDNITVTTKTGKYVANLDGYNENAQPDASPQALKVQAKERTLDSTASSDDAADSTGVSAKTVIVYIGIGVLGLIVLAVIVLLIRRAKNRFY